MTWDRHIVCPRLYLYMSLWPMNSKQSNGSCDGLVWYRWPEQKVPCNIVSSRAIKI